MRVARSNNKYHSSVEEIPAAATASAQPRLAWKAQANSREMKAAKKEVSFQRW